MSEMMSNAPVYYALAQARFNTIVNMEHYAPAIQDVLRRKGYTHFDPQYSNQLVLEASDNLQHSDPRVEKSVSWYLTRNDRKSGFILGQESITYHTTHYQTHKEFIPELLVGLAAVNEVVSLDHVSRLGLRYLDAVCPSEGESVRDYLARGLHGIEFDIIEQQGMVESVFRTSIEPPKLFGTLVSRVFRSHGQLGFPANIRPHGLLIDPRFDMQNPRTHAVVDTDHFVEAEMPIDATQLEARLNALHEKVKAVFRATTTSHAFVKWE